MTASNDNATQTVQVSLRLPKDSVDALGELAQDNDRTLSQEVRRAIRFYLESREAEAA